MKPNGVINLILPAVEIVQDHQPTDTLLAALGTSTKEVIEMFLNAWAEFKQLDGSDMPYYGYGYDSEAQDRALRQNFNINARLLVMDIIFDAMERRVEQGLGMKIGEDDRRSAERVLMSIWAHLSANIFELLEEMNLSDLQISQLKFVKWVGDDFVISIPYHQTAHSVSQRRTHYGR